MAYSVTWDETIPAGSEARSLGDNRIREFKTQIRERLEEFLIDDMDADPVVPNSKLTYFDSGTKTDFFQAAAPTGWTQDATHNDKYLRVVSGAGGGAGGSKSLSAYQLTTAELPPHTHTVPLQGTWEDEYLHAEWSSVIDHASQGANNGGAYTENSGSTGGATALSPYYVDVIICTKD